MKSFSFQSIHTYLVHLHVLPCTPAEQVPIKGAMLPTAYFASFHRGEVKEASGKVYKMSCVNKITVSKPYLM